MKKQYVMAFDAGTGAGRCVLADLDGNLAASAYREWGYTTPENGPENAADFDPDVFWGILAELSRQCIRDSGVDPGDIVGVSTTSQREGMVFIDETGRELYAGPNIDLRGAGEVDHFEPHRAEIRAITGLRLFGIYGPARLRWFKHNQPSIFNRIHRVMMMSDWIAFRLSGVPSSEPSVASSSQLLDLGKRAWSAEVQTWAGVPGDWFPQIFEAGEQIGTVTPQAAADTGLTPGTAVAAGGGDTQVGLLGMGITEANRLGAVAGTSTPLMYTLDRVVHDPDEFVSTNCYVRPDLWTFESNAGMTGMPYRWVRDNFAQADLAAAADQHLDDYEILNRLAAEVPPGADGWRAFIGSGPAGIRKQGRIGGFLFPITWIMDHFDRRHLYRAALETMVFGIRSNADQLARLAPAEIRELAVSGGQTRGEVFNQMLADTLNLPISVFHVKEASSLGAALCAAVGAGCYAGLQEAAEKMVHVERIFEPNGTLVPVYQEAFERWSSLGTHLAAFAD